MTLNKEEEREFRKLMDERTKWRHFFEILRRWYICVPLVVVIVYLKESPPLHIPIVDQIIKGVARVFGVVLP